MFKDMGKQTLKNGETALLARITGPDEEWADRLTGFLGHKGGAWNRQIERSLHEDLSPLASHYYVACLPSGELMANVGIFRSGPVGEFGHVFTSPDHRRKGLAGLLCRLSVEDFDSEGGEALFLGTGYNSPPYHIYRKTGFESVIPGSGFMERYRKGREEFLAEYYAPSETDTARLEYRDWPGCTALLSLEKGGFLRLPGLNHNGRSNFESKFIALIEEVEAGTARCFVSRSRKTGAVTAMAVLREDVRFHGARCLDAFGLPEFGEALEAAVRAALEETEGPVMAFLEKEDSARAEILEKSGMRRAAVLEGALRVPPGFQGEGSPSDLLVMTLS